ncbi:MAG: glycoside hydrolase family 9 protein [Verrucomicrobiota bacterium]
MQSNFTPKIYMKKLLILVGFLCCFAPANAQQLSFKEIRTASDTVLVAFFKDAYWSGNVWDMQFSINQVVTSNPSAWKLNGQPVGALNEFVTEANAVDYHVYMQVPKLTNGMSYTLETPYGNTNFVFDDTKIFCESIKVNQNGYSALAQTRYANLAIWLGTGGAQQISGSLPTYTVFKQFTGEQVASGTLQTFGGGTKDTSSGDYVYRIDLSAVPEGGPYKISVSGYGCSYPFGVGGDFARRLEYVAFRAMYYQRCGCPIVMPYAWANIRPYGCHTNVYDTEAANAETLPGGAVQTTQPKLNVHGGYHDAGDADRRGYHLMVPIVLLTTYEMFPNLFSDDQYNIPDIFDANYNIIGKGNGIPDIIDEAVWGTMFWTNVQSTSREPSGAVAWGSNASGYPNWGINYDQDTLLWGTEANDVNSCGLASGLFMNLARVLKPYDPVNSASLQARADAAYAAAGSGIKTSHKLYYAIQKYLLTGDVTASNTINSLYTSASGLAGSYNKEAGGFLVDGGIWLANYFMSYIIETNRPTNPTIVAYFKTQLKAAADNQVNWTTNDAYPVGWPANVNPSSYNFAQGGLTPQGQFAYPCLMQWALTGEQKYMDAVSQLMDYDQGLNPLGKCYMTGIGFDRVHHPEDRESAYAEYTMGWGTEPQPGITVYGPLAGAPGNQIPALSGLARERQFFDHMGYFQMAEFTVYQSEVFPAAIYPVLAQGGKWNATNDPFSYQAGGSTGLPPIPTGLAAVAGNAQVALTWNVASSATGYNVLRSTTNGSGFTIIASPTGNSYTDSPLVNGTTYYYEVNATNSYGNSANTAQVSAAPSALPPTPTGLAAVPGNAQVVLTWNAASGATGYNVQRSTTSGSGFTTIATPTATTYTDSSLANGTTYYYEVNATNSYGNSANTAQVSATPLAPPATPAGLTAVPGGGLVVLSWNAAATASGYNLLRSTNSGSGYATITSRSSTNYTDAGLTPGRTYYYEVNATNIGGTSANSAYASATPTQPLSQYMTNLFGVFNSSADIATWANSGQSTAITPSFIAGDAPPGQTLSTGALGFTGTYGPLSTHSWGGLTGTFPTADLSHYTALEFDFKVLNNCWDLNSQIQQLQPVLADGGSVYLQSSANPAVNGPISTNNGWRHFSIPLSTFGTPLTGINRMHNYIYDADYSTATLMTVEFCNFMFTGQAVTPLFFGLASHTITNGTPSVTLTGSVGNNNPYLPSGRVVTVTINGTPQTTTISDSTGDFSINYNTASLPASGTPYTVTYSTAKDNVYWGDGIDTSTTLTVNSVSAPRPQIGGVSISSGQLIFSYPTVSGHNYQLQYCTDLSSGSWVPVGSSVSGTGATVWATNSIGSMQQQYFRLYVTP